MKNQVVKIQKATTNLKLLVDQSLMILPVKSEPHRV